MLKQLLGKDTDLAVNVLSHQRRNNVRLLNSGVLRSKPMSSLNNAEPSLILRPERALSLSLCEGPCELGMLVSSLCGGDEYNRDFHLAI